MNIMYIRTGGIYDDSRATKEIMGLVKAGHHIHILGWNRDGKALERCLEVFKPWREQIRLSFFYAKVEGGIGVRNLDKLIKWLWWTRKQLKQDTSIEIIHACNLDAALGVASYAKKRQIPMVYDIYDYYLDSHSIPSFLQGMVERLEIGIINEAKATIICTEERQEQIAGAKPKELVVIHNSPEVENVNKAEIRYDYAYCGSLFGQRLLKEIFETYPKYPEMKFAIAGYGQYEQEASQLDKSYENFTFVGPIPYAEVLKIESQSRVISAIYEPTIRNHRLCAPNKFYEALALAKPVIVCKGTGIDKIVEANDIGIVINYSAKEFFQALKTLSEDEGRCEAMGQRARSLYEREYRWDLMEERLINLYHRLR